MNSDDTAVPSGTVEPETLEVAVRCTAIAHWWDHAARGRCTVDAAVEATAALIHAIDSVEPPTCG